jgi:hypothetical protein
MISADNLVTPPSRDDQEMWDRQRREDADLNMRSQALTAALHTHNGSNAADIVSAAETYRQFLAGIADSPTVQ